GGRGEGEDQNAQGGCESRRGDSSRAHLSPGGGMGDGSVGGAGVDRPAPRLSGRGRGWKTPPPTPRGGGKARKGEGQREKDGGQRDKEQGTKDEGHGASYGGKTSGPVRGP